jgi:hypothetical protein
MRERLCAWAPSPAEKRKGFGRLLPKPFHLIGNVSADAGPSFFGLLGAIEFGAQAR